jgi:hypothetical protein
MPAKRVINPATGRPILVGGPVHKSLLAAGYKGLAQAPSLQRATHGVAGQLTQERLARMKALPLASPRSIKSLLGTKQPPHLHRNLLKLAEAQARGEGRGVRTRGWSAMEPKRGRERHAMKATCGDACFLQPANEGFPICRKLSMTGGKCKVDCKGLQTAYVRARQWRHTEVAEQAKALAKIFGCEK